MNDLEIEETKLILTFLDCPIFNKEYFAGMVEECCKITSLKVSLEAGRYHHCIPLRFCEFQHSWEWLMILVDKIESVCGASVETRQAYCEISHHISKK